MHDNDFEIHTNRQQDRGDFVLRGVQEMAPISMEMPSSDYCQYLGNFDPNSRPVFISEKRLEAIHKHLSQQRDDQIGVPVGFYGIDSAGRKFYKIIAYFPLKPTSARYDRFEVPASEHLRVSGEVDKLRERYPGLEILGWIHSHPEQVPEASGVDITLASQHYRDPLLTIILNPFRQNMACFELQTSGFLPGQQRQVVDGGEYLLRDKGGMVIYDANKSRRPNIDYTYFNKST